MLLQPVNYHDILRPSSSRRVIVPLFGFCFQDSGREKNNEKIETKSNSTVLTQHDLFECSIRIVSFLIHYLKLSDGGHCLMNQLEM